MFLLLIVVGQMQVIENWQALMLDYSCSDDLGKKVQLQCTQLYDVINRYDV